MNIIGWLKKKMMDDPLDWVKKNISIETEDNKDKDKQHTKEVINFVFPK